MSYHTEMDDKMCNECWDILKWYSGYQVEYPEKEFQGNHTFSIE